MDRERFCRLAGLFEHACGLTPSQRSTFLVEACAGDPDLRAELESLLAEDERGSTSFSLERLCAGTAVSAATPRTPLSVPDRVGPYRVISLLGAGGMGVVYRAEQASPCRIVALKMLRAESLTPECRHRFEREARVLGRLKHPGIAQIYEAGTAEAGTGPQPYFAMELVEGRPLLDYAAAKAFGERERVELVVHLCDAVQHAHEKGVIHRDLKPANVLVEESGQPKILDFGVARATEFDVLATTLHTRAGELVGTVAYMSPEQAEGRPGELDARTDVYSLGVILYELLTGHLPYDVLGKQIAEAVRIIEEDTPAALSGPIQSFCDDLETVVAKALAKEPGRRYSSASELADDLRRYLRDLPVVARPASTMYQLRKLARRHRPLVLAVSGFLLAMALGVVATSSFASREARARGRSERVQRFLLSTLEVEDPTGPNQAVGVAELLARAVERVDLELADQPELAAEVRLAIARRYLSMELLEEAIPLLESVAQSHRLQESAGERARLLSALGFLTCAYHRVLDIDREKQTGRELVGLLAGLPDPGQAPDRPRPADAFLERAVGVHEDLATACSMMRMLYSRCMETGERVAETRAELATLLYSNGEYAEAEKLLRQSLDDAPSPERAVSSAYDLASLLCDTGRLAEADRRSARALDLARATFTEPHHSVARGLYLCARTARLLGHHDRAVALARRSCAMLEELESSSALALRELGLALLERGEPTEAVICLRSSLARVGETEDRIGYHARAWMDLARALFAVGRLREARAMGEHALEVMRSTVRPEHPRVARALGSLAEILVERGEHEEAEAACREALGIIQGCMESRCVPAAELWLTLAEARLAQGDESTAQSFGREALQVLRAALGERHPTVSRALTVAARCAAARGDLGEAEALLREALEIDLCTLGDSHPATTGARAALASLELRSQD